jgi:rhamnose transport system permease protein
MATPAHLDAGTLAPPSPARAFVTAFAANRGALIAFFVFAAVVVGGVAISGGRGNLWGAFAGLLLLACISPALTHLRIDAYWEKAIQGTIILLAVVADGLRSRKGGN